jgi:hypothetical protein
VVSTNAQGREWHENLDLRSSRNEHVDVLRPVTAELLKANTYRLVGENLSSDDQWAFATGEVAIARSVGSPTEGSRSLQCDALVTSRCSRRAADRLASFVKW